MNEPCAHIDQAADVKPNSEGCEDCIPIGARWIHLRMCMMCGHVGCCDQSPNKHASGHFRETGHTLVQSYEPGEDWWYCYTDEIGFHMPDAPSYAHP